MKAVRYHSYGDSGVLVYEDADRPVAGVGQVVVKVAGAAFNPVDVAIRAGFMRQVFPLAFPHIPNFDVAGVVAETGEGVSGWSAGDTVVAFLPMTAPGAAAEYVAAPADVLAAAPRTVELADAAALPSAGLTAWQSLFEHAGLKEGQSVLINGADQVIDYTATPLLQAVAGPRFDAVLNLVRTDAEETAALADLAADGGAFVSTTTPGPENPGREVRAVRVFARSDTGQLAGLVARVDAGDLTI